MSSLLIQFKLVYWPFGQNNIHITFYFWPRLARKEVNAPLIERVKGVAKTLIFSLWLAHSSHSSLWYLCILPRDWYYIQKGSKLLMCTSISLLKQHFLLLIKFCIYLERCRKFKFEAVWIFYVKVFQCKWGWHLWSWDSSWLNNMGTICKQISWTLESSQVIHYYL